MANTRCRFGKMDEKRERGAMLLSEPESSSFDASQGAQSSEHDHL